MPTYEYQCQNKKCNHEWEEIQSISEEALQTCPVCKKETAKRLISNSSFILKGGGWAADKYSTK